MGNITSIGGAPQQVVRVVKDGKALEFDNDMAAEELLVVYPKYVVCQDQVHENGQVKRKMLVPKDVLRRGQVYLLLQLPKQKQQQMQMQQQNAHIGSAHRAPKVHPVDVPLTGGEHTAHPPQKIGATVKPSISKQQIAKILQEGSVKITTTNGVTRTLSGAQLSRLLHQASNKSSMYPKKPDSWLESIPEEPIKTAFEPMSFMGSKAVLKAVPI